MRRFLASTSVVAVVALAAGCGASDDPQATPTASDKATTGPAPYSTRQFVVPFTVDPPSWLPPAPAADEERFLTWVGDGVDVDRAVRFIAPVGIYDPADGGRRLRPVPGDYVGYLRGLERYGGDISAPTSMEVDGHPATLVTASTTTGLSGSLGCQERGLAPDDCYGLQDFALLHIAVMDVDGVTVLAWARTLPGAAESEDDFAAFEEMLAGLEFR
ncbi:MAG: hypothetical protein M3237_15810 [Actinomycetota bacterium]|nr:hypothetical protein [Actinomycetota bacterium]